MSKAISDLSRIPLLCASLNKVLILLIQHQHIEHQNNAFVVSLFLAIVNFHVYLTNHTIRFV